MTGHTIVQDLESKFLLFAHRIPFLMERNYLTLPSITGDFTPDPIADIWTVLALLIYRYNDDTNRFIKTKDCIGNCYSFPVLSVDVYNSGYTGDEFSRSYNFPIIQAVLDELLMNQYVEGVFHFGYTDQKKLKLSVRGMEALDNHISNLPE